jgi:hypothetical protein
MPFADPDDRRAYMAEYMRNRHRAHPELDQAKQRHRTAADQIMRERYRPEYDRLVTSLTYEGIKGNARYRQALKTLKERHPRAWEQARDEARSATVADSEKGK